MTTNSVADDIATLRLFNAHVDELASSSFAEFIRTKPLRFKFRLSDAGSEFETSGVPHEAVKAFVLTMRMFLQQRDAISLERIAALMWRVPIKAPLRDRFTRSYAKWKAAIEGDTIFVVAGKAVNRRRLLEVFLYGALAHLNPDKRREFEDWREHPMFGLLEMQFHYTLRETYTLLRWIQHFNAEVIDALSA